MGWFKRLFGLGSEPAPSSVAAKSVARHTGTANLPSPPAGFTWQPFHEARMIVLRPDGWYVHQVGNEASFTGCVSKKSAFRPKAASRRG